VNFDRGDLNAQKTAISGTAVREEDFGLDPTGNWTDYVQKTSGATDLDQDRAHNKVNEVTAITAAVGADWTDPVHDRCGNMTTLPKPENWSAHYDLTYDAWNRLVKVEDGANTVAEYQYDGRSFRVVKKVYDAGQLDETRHFYYTGRWQCLEERLESGGSISAYADRQFVWGRRYIDDLILRERDADQSSGTGNLGTTGSGLEERLYSMQDPNWNLVAIAAPDGTVQERYAYSAYGTPAVLTPAFASRAGSNHAWETRFAGAGRPIEDGEIGHVLESVQKRYFDDTKSPARKALDRALQAILDRRQADLAAAGIPQDQRERLVDVVRRFLRVPTTLVRCFPIHQYDTKEPHLAVRSMLDTEDASGVSWRAKFEGFIDFLVDRCSAAEREDYLKAAASTNTGDIRVKAEDQTADGEEGEEARMTLANVREATGKTKRSLRSQLMRAFNTPFFPDIFVCSQVMGEGVDLQRYCCHVIHHDLAWNPSSIEQRTGRIDRLGCKACTPQPEQPVPIYVYLPYLSGTADERQFRVMTDREQWFRIVMGQDEVAKLIPCDDSQNSPRLPRASSEGLTFRLGLEEAVDR
jgi:YD repeat-containing protein